MLRMRITLPDICSGVLKITYIHIKNKRPAELHQEYMLGGVEGLIEQQTHYS